MFVGLCVLDLLFPDGAPVEVKELEGAVIVFADNLAFFLSSWHNTKATFLGWEHNEF